MCVCSCVCVCGGALGGPLRVCPGGRPRRALGLGVSYPWGALYILTLSFIAEGLVYTLCVCVRVPLLLWSWLARAVAAAEG